MLLINNLIAHSKTVFFKGLYILVKNLLPCFSWNWLLHSIVLWHFKWLHLILTCLANAHFVKKFYPILLFKNAFKYSCLEPHGVVTAFYKLTSQTFSLQHVVNSVCDSVDNSLFNQGRKGFLCYFKKYIYIMIYIYAFERCLHCIQGTHLHFIRSSWSSAIILNNKPQNSNSVCFKLIQNKPSVKQCLPVLLKYSSKLMSTQNCVSEGHPDLALESDNDCQELLTVSIHKFLRNGSFNLVFIARTEHNHWSLLCTGSWWCHRRTAGPERRRQSRNCLQETKGLWETDTTSSRVLQVLYRNHSTLKLICVVFMIYVEWNKLQ